MYTRNRNIFISFEEFHITSELTRVFNVKIRWVSVNHHDNGDDENDHNNTATPNVYGDAAYTNYSFE